jgi:hypothetical protein
MCSRRRRNFSNVNARNIAFAINWYRAMLKKEREIKADTFSLEECGRGGSFAFRDSGNHRSRLTWSDLGGGQRVCSGLIACRKQVWERAGVSSGWLKGPKRYH